MCLHAGKVADASIDLAKELLQYRPRPMPDDACTCRHGWNMTRVPMSCPSPWESMAETSSVSVACTLEAHQNMCVDAAASHAAAA